MSEPERLPSGNPIEREVLLPWRDGQEMRVATDGYRIFVRAVPHLAKNVEDEWILLWDHKQFDVPAYKEAFIEQIFRGAKS